MRCYAVHLGDCAGGRSKEHYVSASVMEIGGAAIQISGFPWQRAGETKRVGAASLAAKILCRHHNEQLSPLDSVGKDFLAGLKSSFDELSGGLSDNTYQVDGNKLELWLLKVLCGMLAIYKVPVPTTWVEILFQRKPWPDGEGMHILTAPGALGWYFTLVRVTLLTVTQDRSRIAGAMFGLGGLALILAFGTPRLTGPGMQALYRPARILIEKDGRQNQHVLSWNDQGVRASVALQVTSEIDDPATGPRPMVEPVR